jgi:hypothetical protein
MKRAHTFCSCFGNPVVSASNWKALRALNLSKNAITELDGSLKSLPKLEWLDLSHNKLSEIRDLELCPNLKSLNLSFNNIENLSGLTFNSDLIVELLLRHNRLISIDGIEKCPRLEKLDLSYNQIGGFGDLTKLQELRCMKFLWLEMNPVSYNAQYIQEIKSLYSPPEIFSEIFLDGKRLYEKVINAQAGIADSERNLSNPRSYTPSPISNRNPSKQKRVIQLHESNGSTRSRSQVSKSAFVSLSNSSVISHMEALEKEAGSKWLTIITEQKSHSRPSHLDASYSSFFSQNAAEPEQKSFDQVNVASLISESNITHNYDNRSENILINSPKDEAKGLNVVEETDVLNSEVRDSDKFGAQSSNDELANSLKKDSQNVVKSESDLVSKTYSQKFNNSDSALKNDSLRNSVASHLDEDVDQVIARETLSEFSFDDNDNRIVDFLNHKHWLVTSNSGKFIISMSSNSITERDTRGRIRSNIKFSDTKSALCELTENRLNIELHNDSNVTYEFESEHDLSEFISSISTFIFVSQKSIKEEEKSTKTEDFGSIKSNSKRSSVYVINHNLNQLLFLIYDYFDHNVSSKERGSSDSQFAEDIFLMKSFVEQVIFFLFC